MVAIWAVDVATGAPDVKENSLEIDKAIRLNTGSIIDLTEFNLVLDKKVTAKDIADMEAKVQASMDAVIPLSSLGSDDPDKTATATELTAQYGNQAFLDGLGNIVFRSTLFSLTQVKTDTHKAGGVLVPRWTRVEKAR